MALELSFSEARQRLKDSNVARWSLVVADFRGEVWPKINPTFRLSPTDTVFTIGSCFARNIEEHLARLGCTVPMLHLKLPPEEWRGAANSAMNKFHPPAFEQSLAWTARIFDRDGIVTWEDCSQFALDCGDGAFFDLDMGATPPVCRQRFVERRQHIYDVFKFAFAADCVTMTPGLIEAWIDTETGLYTHEGPQSRPTLANGSRFSFRQLTFLECKRALKSSIIMIRDRNPKVKFILTTSPVPLIATFTGHDVRVANTLSKSTLRAACGELVNECDQLDYFPSFESATMSNPEFVWAEDRIHVTYGFVGKIVQHLLANYFSDPSSPKARFQAAITQTAVGNNPAAKTLLEQAIAEDPTFIAAKIALADVHISMGSTSVAIEMLATVLKAEPENIEAALCMVRAILHKKSHRSEDYAIYLEMSARSERCELVHALRIQRLSAQLSFSQKIKIFELLVARFPLNAAIYPDFVKAVQESGDANRASDMIRHAYSLHKPPFEIFEQYIQDLAGSRQYETCRQVIVEARVRFGDAGAEKLAELVTP